MWFHRYPSHASMWVAPIRSGLGDQKSNDYESSMEDWYRFTDQTKNYYGVDMSVLTKPFSQEQKKYYLQVISMILTSVDFYLFLFISQWIDLYFMLYIVVGRLLAIIFTIFFCVESHSHVACESPPPLPLEMFPLLLPL